MTDQNRSGSPQDDRSRGFIEFDYIPFEDIVWGKKLGSGSFGLVHRGKQFIFIGFPTSDEDRQTDVGARERA
jgi:hypothetical protein